MHIGRNILLAGSEKLMKKIIQIALLCLFVFIFSGCGSNKQDLSGISTKPEASSSNNAVTDKSAITDNSADVQPVKESALDDEAQMARIEAEMTAAEAAIPKSVNFFSQADWEDKEFKIHSGPGKIDFMQKDYDAAIKIAGSLTPMLRDWANIEVNYKIYLNGVECGLAVADTTGLKKGSTWEYSANGWIEPAQNTGDLNYALSQIICFDDKGELTYLYLNGFYPYLGE